MLAPDLHDGVILRCQKINRSRLPIKPYPYKFLLALLLWPLVGVSAELPVLGATTVSGNATSAVFRAGASAGAGDYRTQFQAGEQVTITARIQVAPADVNLPGNVYVLIALEGQYFMQDSNGGFQPWNLDPASLVATRAYTALPAQSDLTILGNIALGPLGLAGRSLQVYLAYNLNNAPQEFHYSSAPLQIGIAAYDPLQVAAVSAQTLATSMTDSARNREIPLLIFLPDDPGPVPVILFSHGLGGSYETAVYLGEHWAARGYVAVFMQHRGSDDSILIGVPAAQLLSVMQAAASAENLVLRTEDVRAVIDQLTVWNADSSHALGQRLDLQRIGMSGHSFGARTTQTTSGEIIPWLSYSTRDPRIKAAMPLSASVTNIATAATVLREVNIPWLIMTGTLDESIVNDTTVADRLAVFPALPPGNKYELVLFEGEHHAFTDRPVSALQKPRNPAHHPAIKAISTAFWDSYLRDDASARAWLESDAARSVLAPADSWQFK